MEQKTTAPLHAGPGEFRNADDITLDDIQSDSISTLAKKHFGKKGKWNPKVIESIVKTELEPNNYNSKKLMLLEHEQCLETYLWPHFDGQKATTHQIVLICLMVNEKIRQRISPWETFETDPAKFSALFQQVLRLVVSPDADGLPLNERRFLLIFLIHCFQNLAIQIVRTECQRLVSISIWSNLVHDAFREKILNESPPLRKLWNTSTKKFNTADEGAQSTLIFERTWLSELINGFVNLIYKIPDEGEVDGELVLYCERVLEFLVDLEAQLPTRRFVNTLLDDHQTVSLCKMAPFMMRDDSTVGLLKQLLERLELYTKFEINDQTGLALTDLDIAESHSNQLIELQHTVFSHFKDIMPDLPTANLASIEQRSDLEWHFTSASVNDLKRLCEILGIRNSPLLDSHKKHLDQRSFLLEVLIAKYEKRSSQIERINSMPLYPDEDVLFSDSLVQTQAYSGERPLPLPKLNLQFLTIHDYLLRNFTLFRLESAYEIRQDIEDVVKRLSPRFDYETIKTKFSGWSRMALPLEKLEVLDAAQPNVGEDQPAFVHADITYDVGHYKDFIKHEWDRLRKHDVLFLVSIIAHEDTEGEYKAGTDFRKHFGIKHVRGCEVVDRVDQYGRLVSESGKMGVEGSSRKIRVALDPNQFRIDQSGTDGHSFYDTFNILVRRKPQENNFKTVLETMRDLMQSDLVVPTWLQKVFLGYGDPAGAHYTNMPNRIQEMDFRDTFLDLDHLKESFPTKAVKVAPDALEPPFVIRSTLEQSEAKQEKPKKKSKKDTKSESGEAQETLQVSTYRSENSGPYPQDIPKKNSIRFTPTQVEAIRSGMNLGLTMVVGPPGTGKTDIAVQTIANLYHNYPDQHTLVVTHSNQALNQIFEKIMKLDIDPRHLLRLGHGEEELNSEVNFGKHGRVSSFLQRGSQLLTQVTRLAVSLGQYPSHGSSCETAGYFFSTHVLKLWEKYQQETVKGDVKVIRDHFPFSAYFENAPKKTFTEDMDREQALEAAVGCFKHLEKIFAELEEIRPFELLRAQNHRVNYLLKKEAKIIAMTCTHAALKRRELVNLNFKYDNIVIEEAAQILEIETFIPLLLQEPEHGDSRLKRVVLIGDHHQLPPVVKNSAFQHYGNMEQSMFARFVRLGVPTLQLDAQGRGRPSIAKLYSWRYNGLGDLPLISTKPEFQTANPGFTYEYQLIHVGEYQNNGETTPVPYFYQNLGEAEYVVQMYKFMRLIGYPAEKISILTTYNGQKTLINDVLAHQCDWNPYFGRPATVTTVDRYQGQQNDYILLSLVRTKTAGHLRDVRRLIVSMSRARLGLYVFCDKTLFENYYELKPVFDQLLKHPCQLSLHHDEYYPNTKRKANGKAKAATLMENVEELAATVSKLSKEQLDSVQPSDSEDDDMQIDQMQIDAMYEEEEDDA